LTWLEPPDLPCNSVYTRPLSFRGRRDGPTESACVHCHFRSLGFLAPWVRDPLSSSLLNGPRRPSLHRSLRRLRFEKPFADSSSR
jgi:hypothetical protein